MRIEKKAWPEEFQKVMAGEKNFELRLADWECKAGDVLVLREWSPKTKGYTGRTVEKRVRCVVKTNGQKWFSEDDVKKHGWQVIGF